MVPRLHQRHFKLCKSCFQAVQQVLQAKPKMLQADDTHRVLLHALHLALPRCSAMPHPGWPCSGSVAPSEKPYTPVL